MTAYRKLWERVYGGEGLRELPSRLLAAAKRTKRKLDHLAVGDPDAAELTARAAVITERWEYLQRIQGKWIPLTRYWPVKPLTTAQLLKMVVRDSADRFNLLKTSQEIGWAVTSRVCIKLPDREAALVRNEPPVEGAPVRVLPWSDWLGSLKPGHAASATEERVEDGDTVVWRYGDIAAFNAAHVLSVTSRWPTVEVTINSSVAQFHVAGNLVAVIASRLAK